MKCDCTNKKLTAGIQNCLVKIIDFARAISLDEESITAGGIAVTMADEIQSYGAKALDLLTDEED